MLRCFWKHKLKDHKGKEEEEALMDTTTLRALLLNVQKHI
jgi:hypothetical protein